MSSNSNQSQIVHGAANLPSVSVDSYNLELRDKGGFIGDRASKGAFLEILDDEREQVRRIGEDPLGEDATALMGKKALDELLQEPASDAAGVVHGAIEKFSQEMASVLKRFVRSKGWQETERIVVGGGFRRSTIGETAIGRTSSLLRAGGISVDLVPIRNHPDDAGLIGAAHLMPAWTLRGHDAILAVDIGGSNIRAGVVTLDLKLDSSLAKAKVWKSDLWRHADESPNRDQSVARLVTMLEQLIRAAAKEKLTLAPLIGVGCPGLIASDGSIERGGQNLPGGNWESNRFNLPARLAQALPRIGDDDTMVVMHNDAVVQGLSEVPFMQDVKRWGVITIGTGLGNARFTNNETT